MLAAWPLVLLAGCGSIFGFDDPVLRTQDALSPDAPVTATDGPAIDAAGYHATAVRFEEAGNDYMTTGSLMNTTDSPRGTYSVWLHFNSGDGQQQLLSIAQFIESGGVFRTSNNTFELLMQNCLGAVLLDMKTSVPYTSASGWVHLLASWDVSAGRAQLYVNDVADLAPSPTINNGNICYASLKWGIGGLSSGKLDADVADLYADLGTSIDISVATNRQRFSSPAGKPVDLGDHCMTPSGAIPTGCFTGNVATWNTNKGVGAGFTLSGDGLTLAPTSPSD